MSHSLPLSLAEREIRTMCFTLLKLHCSVLLGYLLSRNLTGWPAQSFGEVPLSPLTVDDSWEGTVTLSLGVLDTTLFLPSFLPSAPSLPPSLLTWCLAHLGSWC